MNDKPRRPPNLTEKVAILTRQALCACGCGQRLAGRKIEYHHMHERALGGPDHVDNWAAVVADDNGERNCHDVITNGTKATTAGSSKHKIAKAERLELARKVLEGTAPPKPPAELTEKFQTIGTRTPSRRNRPLDPWSRDKAPIGAAATIAAAEGDMLIPKRRGYRLDKPQKGRKR